MTTSDFLSYLGIIIGVVTGVAGAIMGYLGLRRSDQFKSLDLRLELKRARNSLASGVDSLPELLNYAKKSHTHAAAAAQMFHSGATKGWLEDWGNDQVVVDALISDVHASLIELSKLSPTELEDQLVAVYDLQRRYDLIKSKYDASLKDDEVRRTHVRENAMLVTQAKLNKPAS